MTSIITIIIITIICPITIINILNTTTNSTSIANSTSALVDKWKDTCLPSDLLGQSPLDKLIYHQGALCPRFST